MRQTLTTMESIIQFMQLNQLERLYNHIKLLPV